jgi:hypothetical protein
MLSTVTTKMKRRQRREQQSAEQLTPEGTLISHPTCKGHLAGMLPSPDCNQATPFIASTHNLGKVMPLDVVSQSIRSDRIHPVVKWAARSQWMKRQISDENVLRNRLERARVCRMVASRQIFGRTLLALEMLEMGRPLLCRGRCRRLLRAQRGRGNER